MRDVCNTVCNIERTLRRCRDAIFRSVPVAGNLDALLGRRPRRREGGWLDDEARVVEADFVLVLGYPHVRAPVLRHDEFLIPVFDAVRIVHLVDEAVLDKIVYRLVRKRCVHEFPVQYRIGFSVVDGLGEVVRHPVEGADPTRHVRHAVRFPGTVHVSHIEVIYDVHQRQALVGFPVWSKLRHCLHIRQRVFKELGFEDVAHNVQVPVLGLDAFGDASPFNRLDNWVVDQIVFVGLDGFGRKNGVGVHRPFDDMVVDRVQQILLEGISVFEVPGPNVVAFNGTVHRSKDCQSDRLIVQQRFKQPHRGQRFAELDQIVVLFNDLADRTVQFLRFICRLYKGSPREGSDQRCESPHRHPVHRRGGMGTKRAPLVVGSREGGLDARNREVGEFREGPTGFRIPWL